MCSPAQQPLSLLRAILLKTLSLCYLMGCQPHGLSTGELVNQAGLSVNSIPLTRSLVRGEQVTKARPIRIFLGTQYSYCERTYLLQRSHELKMITWSVWLPSLPLWGESMLEQDTDPRSRRSQTWRKAGSWWYCLSICTRHVLS